MKTLLPYAALSLLTVAATAHAADYPKLDFGGYLMVDHDQFSDLFLERDEGDNQGTDIRRARLSAEAQFSKNWQSKVQIDVSDGVSIKDAYIQYKGWDWAAVTVGQQKEPFGLEKLTGSRNVFMIERSMVSEALAPGRTIGAQLNGKLKSFNWQVGYFQEDNSQQSNAVTGRLTWALKDKENNFLHLGAAFSERRLKGDTFRINETLEVYSSDSLLEGDTLLAEDASLAGLEFMWQYHGFVSMAEWQQADIEDKNFGTYRYEGGYYQMSYALSGKNRRYKNGKLKGIKASNDWELTWRLSQFRLVEENRKAKNWSVGVNYLLNKDLMFKANYIHAKHQEDGETFGADGAFSLRAQYSF